MATVAYSVGRMGIVLTGLSLFLIFFGFNCWFFYGLKVKPQPNSQNLLRGQTCPLATPIACIVTSTWLHFYRQNLAKPGIDYWEWANFPESNHVCPELSALLTLPPPKAEVKSILFLLPQQPLQPFTEGDFWQQIHNHMLFSDWHQASCTILGQTSLKNVYAVCFNVSWQTITEILNLQQKISWWQVLNVSVSAEMVEVETAYKQLIRYWHPDLNPSPYAHQFATMINLAYEEYNTLPQVSRLNSFFKLLYKIYSFLSSLKQLKLLKRDT
jgi:hypothetical protein